MRVAVFCFLSSMAFGQFLSERWDRKTDSYLVTLNPQRVQSRSGQKDAAYSAVVTWRQFRTLADGTQSGWPSTVTKVWRDSQGRSRTETAKPGELESNWNGRFTLTEISDPVGRFVYILNDEAKIAYRMAALAGLPPVERQAPATKVAKTVTENLGWATVEGVMAEGTRTTRTISVGPAAKETSIVTTSEEWYSPDLKRPMLLIGHDPRFGERTQRTTNVSREEPNPELFQPPGDYRVVDLNSTITFAIMRRP